MDGNGELPRRRRAFASSGLMRDALRRHLAELAADHDVRAYAEQPMTDEESALAEAADWGPAEDYQVTETPEVARALDRAAQRWPGEARSKLLLRLVKAGGGLLEQDERAEDGAHRAAVLGRSGRYADPAGRHTRPDARPYGHAGGVRAGRGASMRDDLHAAGIALAPHDDGEPLRLAELRASSRLKLPDCCVLDVAIHHQARLATLDDGLAAAARTRGVPVKT